MKEYKTVFSRYAEIDLIEILDYYQEMNPTYTKKILDRVEKRIEDLKQFPERGRVVPELERQNIMNYRELIEENYRIIYSIESNSVIIHSILDSRRNLEELLVRKFMYYYK
jgi:toxin ParE1/3/4